MIYVQIVRGRVGEGSSQAKNLLSDVEFDWSKARDIECQDWSIWIKHLPGGKELQER